MRDFWVHLGVQLATAAVGSVVAIAAHTDYSALGGWAVFAQGTAAMAAEVYNQFIPKKA